MSLPEPTEYLMFRNLQAALLAMTSAAGYYYPLGNVTVKLDPDHAVEDFIREQVNTPLVRPFAYIQRLKETWTLVATGTTAEGVPSGTFDIKTPFVIHWVGESNPTVDEDKARVFFRGCADVERAVFALRNNLKITGRSLDETVNGAEVWALIEGVMTTKRVYGSPYA